MSFVGNPIDDSQARVMFYRFRIKSLPVNILCWKSYSAYQDLGRTVICNTQSYLSGYHISHVEGSTYGLNTRLLGV